MAQGLVRYPDTGCIVEFMQENTPQIAWVLEEQKGRLRLLLPNRRETSLQASRILPWTGPSYEGVSSRDAAVELLEKHRAKRTSFTIDPLELWEMAQGEVEQASALWFAELVMDSPDMDAVAACAHALLNTKSHFKFNPPHFELYSEETVTARLAEQEAAQKREALVGQGSTLFRHLWNIHLKKEQPSVLQSLNLEPAILERLQHAILERIADPESQEDDGLWRLIVKGLPEENHLPLYLAQAWGLVQPHHNFWLDRAGYAPGDAWSAAHAEAIDALNQQAVHDAEQPCTLDLSFVSIDSPTTRDVDDAFHIAALPDGGWKLTLALACPAAHWPFGSELDKAVFRRATSIYLPEATHNMLPEVLGTQTYSLVAHKTKPALLVTCQIDADGTVRSCEPQCGTVRLQANLCYTDCEATLEGEDSPAAAWEEQLRAALALAQTHQARRIRQGAVIIERPELVLRLAGDGENLQVTLEEEPAAPKAHLLVSEMMVLCNAALARWAGERDLTLLHRTQDVAIPKEFSGIWSAPTDVARVVRALAPAVLEVTPRPHAGLGETVYAPSTSPLRRYSDLINEAQILHVLRTGSPRWSREELDALLPLLNARLDVAGQAQRNRPRYWKLLYFRQQGDKTWWPAIITDENDAFITINLPKEQLIVRGRRALFGERTHIGQEVEVRLGKVHPLHNEFQLMETRDV